MRTICLFASYFTTQDIPYYIQVYLKELKQQFDEVVLLSTQKTISEASLNFLKQEHITLFQEKNEGFDFGLWYLAFQKTDLKSFSKVALVNDSCILFRSLDPFMRWMESSKANVKGMTFSEAIYPHLQSYFMVLDQKAVELTENYFKQHGVLNDISEVIETYEVGISKYWQDNGLNIAAFVDNNGYRGDFSPYYHCIHYHLEKGIPLIKKKILFSSYRDTELNTLARMNFKISPQHYICLIKKERNSLLDLKRLGPELGSGMSSFEKLRYTLKRHFIRLLRPFYKRVKHVSKSL